MALESGNWISQLVQANPVATDAVSQGDDHIRLLKTVLQTTFPNASRAFYFPTTHAVLSANHSVTDAQADRWFSVDATATGRTVTLPLEPEDGFTCAVVKTDTSANLVTVGSSELINGASTLLLRRAYDAVILRYNATAATWFALANTHRFGESREVAGAATLALSDLEGLVAMDAAAANRTVTLPNSLPAGFRTKVKKIDSSANTVTLNATGTGQINGVNTFVLDTQWQEAELYWNGTTWSTALGVAATIATEVPAILATLGLLIQPVFREFLTSDTYTPTTGMLFAIAIGTGGGGGGGGVNGQSSGAEFASGGSAGATTIKVLTAAQIGVSKTVTIGAGGTAGANTGGDGGNGGATTISDGLLSVPGGNGGIGATSGAGSAPPDATSPGTGGHVHLPGAPGSTGTSGSNTSNAIGGAGGASFWGGGAPANVVNTAGLAGVVPGSGGGGGNAYNNATAREGGAGAPGYLVILEFIGYA